MAVTASSISSSNTLEQLRTQFNNLVSDVTGLEAGSQTFTLITSSNITVAEDGTIVFEGATNDDNETTLTVVDPTLIERYHYQTHLVQLSYQTHLQMSQHSQMTYS